MDLCLSIAAKLSRISFCFMSNAKGSRLPRLGVVLPLRGSVGLAHPLILCLGLVQPGLGERGDLGDLGVRQPFGSPCETEMIKYNK